MLLNHEVFITTAIDDSPGMVIVMTSSSAGILYYFFRVQIYVTHSPNAAKSSYRWFYDHLRDFPPSFARSPPAFPVKKGLLYDT